MICIQCKRVIDEDVEPYVSHGETGLHDACHDAYRRKQDEHSRLKAMVKPLIDEVNGGSPGDLADAILDALTQSHRHLQNEFLYAVRVALVRYAKLDQGMYVDQRNATMYQWAKRVAGLE